MLQRNPDFNDEDMTDDLRADERLRMVERQIIARGITNPRVLAAMRQIPRHFFIPPPYDRSAYDDNPLPIGNGQTISQPYIVALMTDLLNPGPDDRVLELGTGSGYQTAILAALAKHVVTIERIPGIADLARSNLSRIGISNIEMIVGDGTTGYPAGAPYNAILVTAATPQIPQPLIDQLAEGGRLIAPVGSRDLQELVRITKDREPDHGIPSRRSQVCTPDRETWMGGRKFMKWYDVSRPLSGDMLVYPGDITPSFHQEKTGNYRISDLHMSSPYRNSYRCTQHIISIREIASTRSRSTALSGDAGLLM